MVRAPETKRFDNARNDFSPKALVQVGECVPESGERDDRPSSSTYLGTPRVDVMPDSFDLVGLRAVMTYRVLVASN